jgi:hypothetical protein
MDLASSVEAIRDSTVLGRGGTGGKDGQGGTRMRRAIESDGIWHTASDVEGAGK